MTAIEARPEAAREGERSEHHLRVVVVGAGFSGLSVASRLREVGEEDFLVLERGESVGGVWRDNTYPGVVCDVPSHLVFSVLRAEPRVGSLVLAGASDQGLPRIGH